MSESLQRNEVLCFGKLRSALLFSLVSWFWIGAPVCAPNAFSKTLAGDKPESDPVVLISSATYRGQLIGQEIIGENLALEITRHGTVPGELDLSDVRVALSELRWKDQPLISGTTSDQRMILLTDRDTDELHGRWSAHGTLISGKTVFDLTFPPALNTRVLLTLPAELAMEANQGILRASPAAADAKTREWTLELGHLQSTTLTVGDAEALQHAAPPRYEVETEHRARRDGIFLKSDLTLDGYVPGETSLQLIVSEAIEIQSITMFSGVSQSGAALSIVRSEEDPTQVSLPLAGLKLDSRFTLRVRAFLPVEWGEPIALPRFQIEGAVETRRSVVVRVEPPLQLYAVDAQGMIQTSLASEETTGEVWKYESRNADSQLTVMIDRPRSRVMTELNCVADARRPSGWAAAVISMYVQSGSRFSARIRLPEDWKLVSVAAGDVESRLASWTLEDQELMVIWQNPMTSTSHRQIRLFARTAPWKTQSPLRLQNPEVENSSDVGVNYQVLLPPGTELRILEGEGWRLSEESPVLPALLRMREVTERVSDPQNVTCATLRSSTENRTGRTLVSIVPRTLSVGPLTVKGSGDVSLSVIPPAPAVPEESESPRDAPVAPPVLAMRLLTMAGPTIQHDCLHQADLYFDRPVPSADLNLRLSPHARVSAVSIDGRSVTVFRKGEEIPLPAELKSLSHIRLTYVTRGRQDWLTQLNSIPIPQTGMLVTGFDWTLDLPEEQRLSRISLPGVLEESEQSGNFTREIFGPLSRKSGERMFHPLEKQDWQELLQSANHPAPVSQPRRSLKFVAPTIGESAEFVTWNTSLTRSYSWVALLGCLMIGAAARLFRISWLRQIAIFWLILLLAAASVAPTEWTLIVGGMFSGSLLSMMIPRQWMQKRDFLARPEREDLSTREVVTAVILFLCCRSAWGQSELSEEPLTPSESTPPTEVQAQNIPEYLIESADYDLLRQSPSLEIQATFQILSYRQSQDLFVRLPLQDVVFAPDSECLVNGEKQALIPSVTGDALLVRLPAPTEVVPSEDPPSDLPEGWRRSSVRLKFAIRPGPSLETTENGVITAVPSFRAKIPNVLDSTLHVRSQMDDINFRRWGRTIRKSGQETIELGGIGRLQAGPDARIHLERFGLSAVTTLDVSPLRLKGQTRLIPGAAGWPAMLPLTFPPGSVISSISGTSVIDSIPATPGLDGTSLTLRLRTGSPAPPIIINFELPVRSVMASELSIPEFPLWGGDTVRHTIGMTGPPTSALALVKTPDLVPLAPENWPSQGDPASSRPAVAVKLDSPQPIQLTWNRLVPMRIARVSEDLVIQRDVVNWTATVQISVSQVPSFRHQFRLDPAVRIDSVVTGEGGGDGAVRYTRLGDLVSVFVPGGQLGERVFRISGHIPLTVDAWSAIPNLEVLEAMTSESTITIHDRTDWNLELEAGTGNQVAINLPASSEQTKEGTDKQQLRTLGVFERDSPTCPDRFRLTIPPEATRAESVTLVRTNPDKDWEIISTFHLSAIESTLRRAVFRLPPELVGVRVRPSLFQYTSTTNAQGVTTVSVKVPDRYSSSATITISAFLKPEVREQLLADRSVERARAVLPQIEVLSAQKVLQFVLVAPQSPILPAPTASLRIDAAAFPGWAPTDWIHAVQNHQLTCYQLIRSELNVVKKSASELSGQPIVRLEENVIWPLEGGQISGLTRIWLATKGAQQLHLAHPQQLKIDTVISVERDGVNWSSEPDGTLVTLPARDNLTGLVIHWTLQESDGVVHLLDYGDQQPEHRLLAVTQPDGWHFNAGDAEPADLLQTWLIRWKALLECLNDLSGPVPVDSLLLGNIRQCQKEAGNLIEQPLTNATSWQREEFQRLTSVWNGLKEDLVISGSPRAMATDQFANAFTELLEQRTSTLHVSWIVDPSADWVGHLSMGVVRQLPWMEIQNGLLAALAIFFVWRFRFWLTRMREFFAQRPSWSFFLLGLVWWIWLAPSVVGVLIILVAWSWELMRGITVWFMSSRRHREIHS